MDPSLRKLLSAVLKCPEMYIDDEMVRLLGNLANGFTWNDEFETKVRVLASEIRAEMATTRFLAALEDKIFQAGEA